MINHSYQRTRSSFPLSLTSLPTGLPIRPLLSSALFSCLLLFTGPLSRYAHSQEIDPPSSRIELDIEHRTIQFEALIVRNQGLLEVFACGPKGKTHETLLVTTVSPKALYEACLKIGLSPASRWATTEDELFMIQADKILLEVIFPKTPKPEIAESLLQVAYENRPMRIRGWTFRAKPLSQSTGKSSGSDSPKLPDELEFSLTFKSLRGAALSFFDNPYAYRPFANMDLVVNQKSLPKSLNDEEEHPALKVQVRLQPTDEVALLNAQIDRDGSDPVARKALEAMQPKAREIDQLKQTLMQSMKPNLQRASQKLMLSPPADQESARIHLQELLARTKAQEQNILIAYLNLDILHEKRELELLRTRQSDNESIEYKKLILQEHLRWKQKAELEAQAYTHDAQAHQATLQNHDSQTQDIRPQIEHLRALRCRALIEPIERAPDIDRARTELKRTAKRLLQPDLGEDSREFLTYQKQLAQKILDDHQRKSVAGKTRARLAEIDIALLGNPSKEDRVALTEEKQSLEKDQKIREQQCRIFTIERRLERLASDLRFAKKRPEAFLPDELKKLKEENRSLQQELTDLQRSLGIRPSTSTDKGPLQD
jgi:hypothetical protein